MSEPSLLRRREIIDALRIGSVPRRGLELYGAGLERFEAAIDAELDSALGGAGRFKAVQGEYGAGKTFFARWAEQRALAKGFATAFVQISEDTALHKMETVYRRTVESLRTTEWSTGAFRSLVEQWFFELEREATSPESGVDPADEAAVGEAVRSLLEQRLRPVSVMQPAFAAALRAAHEATMANDTTTAELLIAWLMGQPNVGQDIRRRAHIRGELDNDGAAGFLRGLLELLRQTGRAGLFLVLDEVETIQRLRAEPLARGLNMLRHLIEELVGERYPGLYVLITGTPAFFTGPRGVARLPALEQRLQVDFRGDPRFDSARAPRIRLLPFDEARLLAVGRRVRELYPATDRARLDATVGDDVLAAIITSLSGQLRGQLGIAPRLFLRRLVDLLDKVDEHPTFDPKSHASLPFEEAEMSPEERAISGGAEPAPPPVGASPPGPPSQAAARGPQPPCVHPGEAEPRSGVTVGAPTAALDAIELPATPPRSGDLEG